MGEMTDTHLHFGKGEKYKDEYQISLKYKLSISLKRAGLKIKYIYYSY
jgi:NADPH-dependent 7-cyano-7-deazaguanine reductase QueF-like protein